MFEDILGFDKWRLIEKINRGWSDDVKYYIETYDNQKLLLRVSNIEKYEAKKKNTKLFKDMQNLDLLCRSRSVLVCAIISKTPICY